MAKCAGERRDGTACTTDAPTGSQYCYHHDPKRAEERSLKASRAASAKHDSVMKQIREMREDIRELIHLTVNDELHPAARKKLTDMVQLAQSYARLTELELAAGGKIERDSVALPADLPEKARQLVAAEEEAQDSEKQSDQSQWAEAAAMIEAGGGDASALRYFAEKWG